VLIVESDPVVVERALRAGELACPSCAGELRPWSSARARAVREHEQETTVAPRRSRCSSCKKTHVLLPDRCLLRRRDALVGIGAALLDKAAGLGRRRIGRRLGVHPDTVGGWLRRFARRAEHWRVTCWAWAHALDANLAPIEPAGSVFADAVSALGLAMATATRLLGPRPGWGWAAVLSSGELLANTGSPSLGA
jgi:transposase-like protein